jgi:hypothetical protein
VGEDGRQAGVVVAWCREARGGVEGVRERLEESSAREVLAVAGDSASTSALCAFLWRKLLRMWLARRSEVVHLGGGLQWLTSAAVVRGRVRVTTWCGAEEEKKGLLCSVVRSFYSCKRRWNVGSAAVALSVARGGGRQSCGHGNEVAAAV